MTATVDLPASATETATIPLRPMLGRVAVAPAGAEAFGGLWPGLRKRNAIAWPRFEGAEHIMVAGSARPLSDAARIACVELVRWLAAEHGFGTADAYPLVSQVAVLRVANMVDPLYTVVAKFPKSQLPAPGSRRASRVEGQ